MSSSSGPKFSLPTVGMFSRAETEAQKRRRENDRDDQEVSSKCLRPSASAASRVSLAIL